MENEEFQKLVLAHFDKLSDRFGGIEARLGNIEELLKQHHEDTEKIAVQVRANGNYSRKNATRYELFS